LTAAIAATAARRRLLFGAFAAAASPASAVAITAICEGRSGEQAQAQRGCHRRSERLHSHFRLTLSSWESPEWPFALSVLNGA